MGEEMDRLVEQLRRAFEGEAWHGPSVLEVLEGVTAQQAAAYPIAGAHSIMELVLHLGGTYRLVLRRLNGDGRQLSPQEDWPDPALAGHWADEVAALRQLHSELVQAVSQFPEGGLNHALVPESSYTAYTQFIGVTQHNLYHAGQMALLRRVLGATHDE